MNENLSKAVKLYSLAPHAKYAEYMHGFSKDTVIGMFTDLLTVYINDKNSSTLREFITVSAAGYKHRNSKIGYNGYKQDVAGTSVDCEAKPKNVDSHEYAEFRRKERKSFRKLNGGGNFTDYTWARFAKDCGENLHMLVSGFVDGKLIYILEFPFSEESFKNKLELQLRRHFPDGDVAGRFLRSAGFDYNDFMDGQNLKIVYGNSELLESNKQYMVGGFCKKFAELLGKKQ